MQKDGKGEGERVQTVGTFGKFNDCFDKLISYGVPLGDPRNLLVEYFIVVVDSNDKYVGFLTKEEATQTANYFKKKRWSINDNKNH
tara:strand:- start:3858 stop:4115 length:258 start_codon:yes stop_codon:yes gene_type:complete